MLKAADMTMMNALDEWARGEHDDRNIFPMATGETRAWSVRLTTDAAQHYVVSLTRHVRSAHLSIFHDGHESTIAAAGMKAYRAYEVYEMRARERELRACGKLDFADYVRQCTDARERGWSECTTPYHSGTL